LQKSPLIFFIFSYLLLSPSLPLSLSNLSPPHPPELAAAAPPLPAAPPPRGGAKRRWRGRAAGPAWFSGGDATRLGSGALELGGHGGSMARLRAAHAEPSSLRAAHGGTQRRRRPPWLGARRDRGAHRAEQGRRGDGPSGWRQARDATASPRDGDATATDCPEHNDDCDAGLPLF